MISNYAYGVRVETIQPNGLPRIDYPYYGYGYLASSVAVGLLIFGTVLFIAILQGRTGRPARPLLGSGLMSVGLVVSFFAGFVFLASLSDEGPRCLSGCASSLIRYYEVVDAASLAVIVLGLTATCLGGWLILRKGGPG